MDLLGDLELFEELAEHGSFSAVARQRNRAASSLSRRLDRLEEHLGQRLFNRSPTGLFLTAAGDRKLREARALNRATAAFSERAAEKGQLTGHIAVSAPSRLGAVVVVPAVAAFLEENRLARIDLHLTDQIQDLDRERIDLAVRIGGKTPDHYLLRRIAPNRRILVAAPEYLATVPPIQFVADLDQCDALMLGTATRWKLTGREGKTHVATPKSRMAFVTGDALLTLCTSGLGVALKSAWDAAPYLANGQLVRVLPEWEQAESVDIMMVLPDRRLLSPTLRIFEKVLESRLKEIAVGNNTGGT